MSVGSTVIFFKFKGQQQYTGQLCVLKQLQTALEKKDIENSQTYLSKFTAESSIKFVEDLENFITERSAINENFKFWANFLEMMKIVYDLLRADCEGIWELHLDAIQRALYMFAAFNSTNYLRWCSLYLEDMRDLSVTAPSVYKQFSNGNFSIKDKPGRFTAVGGDQKLEQTVNLSSKRSDAVIGHAKQREFVAQ